VSKHSQDGTVEEDKTAPGDDAEVEPAEVTTEADEPTVTADEPSESAEPDQARRGMDWSRVVAFGVLPGLALILAVAAGFLKWQDNSVRNDEIAGIESVQAAKDTTVKILSYKPDTVDQQLNDARNLLTGDFRDQYTSLINDVVIPGAKQKQISAVASVPEGGAASVSADPNHAVVLVFVNQTVVVGQDVPTDTASSVRVTLDKIDGRWLVSKFDPV
jgi:Mce-associated membrane protein